MSQVEARTIVNSVIVERMAKLLFTTSSFDLDNFRDRSKVESAGYEIVLNPWGKRLTEAQLGSLIDEDVVAMVAGLEPVTKSIIDRATALEVIVRCGIGVDNVDIRAAEKRGVSVLNTPNGPTRAAAELTLAHILSLLRRIPECDRGVRSGRWQALMGSLLAEQTVGVVGFGRIGKQVVDLLRAFRPRLLVYDIVETAELSGVEFVSLDKLIRESDVVTLHVPYGSDTRHLIDADRLNAMKPGAVLVNVARGGLVDEEAMLAALRSGKLAGAALDCCEVEPYSGPLIDIERVQFTAHMGSYAKEARSMMEADACRTLVSELEKRRLL